jgi:hypothetical protein
VVLSGEQDLGTYRYDVRDCQGRNVKSGQVRLAKGLVQLEVPVAGMVALERMPQRADAPADLKVGTTRPGRSALHDHGRSALHDWALTVVLAFRPTSHVRHLARPAPAIED